MRNIFNRENKGITLIALVVTIIVLLLLAGISLAMLTGSNGLLSKATKAGEDSTIGEEKERVAMAYNGALTEKYKTDINATVNAEDMKEEFKRNGTKVREVTQVGNRIMVVFDKTGNVYYIEADGTITSAGSINVGSTTDTLEIEVREDETESRAVALVVKPIIEYSDEDFEQMCVRMQNYYNGNDELSTFDDFVQYWIDESYISEQYTNIGEMAEDNGYDSIEEFLYEWHLEDFITTVATITCNGETQEITYADKQAEFAIAENGKYNIYVTSTKGGVVTTTANITKCKIEEYSEIYEENTELTIEGYTVTIPAGFAVGTSSNVNSVNKGLVITDAIKKVNGKNYSVGNEFVWIPVNKETLKVENTNQLMAKLNGSTNYEGVLYLFEGIGDSTTSIERTNYGQGTTNNREPAYLTNSNYADGSDYNKDSGGNRIVTEASLQSEYNEMIESIQEYGGFYVGRYEMGVENGVAVSKLGVTPTTAWDSETRMWYGLYQKAKTYTNTNKTSNSSVVSSMIWGSQHAAMLNFVIANNSSDKAKVNSTEYGNYSERLLRTGLTRTSDSINNIYDLGGNLGEWTLEADFAGARVRRGGDYWIYRDDPASSHRPGDFPDRTNANLGCRSTLYIK